jgi:hypothetical protein
MPIRKSIKSLLLALALTTGTQAGAETPDRLLTLSHPGVKWNIQFEFPGALEQYNQYKEGAGSYAHGQTIDQRKRYSMVIHQYPGATDARTCREVDAATVRKHPLFAKHEITESESGDSAYLRVRGAGQIEGRAVFSQHVHRFVYRDGLCAKVHVSSTHDDAAIASELTKAVESLSLKDAGGDITRSFHVAPKGTLRLAMPKHWGFQTSNPHGAPARTLTIRAADGHFQFMISIFLAPDSHKDTAATTRKTAESARDRVASNAVQKQIDIQTLKGRDVAGHYIFVSDNKLADKPSVPDNWKHMRQGMLGAGAALATFTVFSNDENAPDALRAMRALTELVFTTE